MSADLALTHSVTEPGPRAVVDYVARGFGLPVVSELRYPSPEGIGDDVVRPVEAVSRIELGERGAPGSRVVVAVENHDGSVTLFGEGFLLRVEGSLVSDLARGVRGSEGEEDLRLALLGWRRRGSAEDPPASNADVEELTRRAHTLTWSDWSLVRPVVGHSLTSVPVLSSTLTPGLVGPGAGVARYLRALRDVEAGAPVEWAFRRALGGER